MDLKFELRVGWLELV